MFWFRKKDLPERQETLFNWGQRFLPLNESLHRSPVTLCLNFLMIIKRLVTTNNDNRKLLFNHQVRDCY